MCIELRSHLNERLSVRPASWRRLVYLVGYYWSIGFRPTWWPIYPKCPKCRLLHVEAVDINCWCEFARESQDVVRS